MFYNLRMQHQFDHILLIGFGGPQSREEVMPFLKRVTAGRNIPEVRLKAVAHHYDMIGGKSPYNDWAADVLAQLLKLSEMNLPIFLAHRNTAPFVEDVILDIHKCGLKKGLGVILAPFRSTASCRRYKENIHDALHTHGIMELKYSYLSPWYNHFDWVRILAKLARDSYLAIPEKIRGQTEILFSCHSIPMLADKACASCIYSAEYEACCRSTADAAGFTEWKHVYQSRSGDPSQPWLSPDILDAIKTSAKAGKKAVFVIPMGFLSDNAEVLYDLDIEAKNLAQELGMEFYRAPTPGNHPDLIRLFGKLIQHAKKEIRAYSACAI